MAGEMHVLLLVPDRYICFIDHGSCCCKIDAQMLKDLPALHCGTEGLEILPSAKSCHSLKVTKSCTNLEARWMLIMFHYEDDGHAVEDPNSVTKAIFKLLGSGPGGLAVVCTHWLKPLTNC
ncbi:hypothetical protein C4D60_Mb03t01730 [Musa balbisiana]|uniref:Uncharacterized protein n=1 Tax=Musa balbisiana TaxID=52838 RepID=A0A4S8J6U3_MUSBA|nr:hypothetical protein C4D60_Mb03t01730 [Musa balbisiana]